MNEPWDRSLRSKHLAVPRIQPTPVAFGVVPQVSRRSCETGRSGPEQAAGGEPEGSHQQGREDSVSDDIEFVKLLGIFVLLVFGPVIVHWIGWL